MLFAERNGFITTNVTPLKNGINRHVINSISNCFAHLCDDLDMEDQRVERSAPWMSFSSSSYYQLCLAIWTQFFNRRSNTYGYRTGDSDAIQRHLLDGSLPWYTKLSMIEFSIDYMERTFKDPERIRIISSFIDNLNMDFERTHYGYRIVAGLITDIISDTDKESIEEVLFSDEDVVKSHMRQALSLYSRRPLPDYKNAIKEAISAVEALCRKRTGESTFGSAYGQIKKTTTIHPRIQEAIQKVYDYTNQADTGIRHSKVSGDDSLVPGATECLFMLVTCSAIINYIQEELIQGAKNTTLVSD